MTLTYTREDDGDEMVEIAPHQFVSKRTAERMGLRLTDAVPRSARASSAGARQRRGSPCSPAADAAKKKIKVPA